MINDRNEGQSEHHAYHLYVIEVNQRKELHEYLRENGIFCQIHYIPAHLMPYYRQIGWNVGDFRNSEDYYSNCLSIPIYPTLTEEEQTRVIKLIESYLG